MTDMKLLSAGLLAVAMLATPAMAQEATQEPGVMGYNYPNSAYLRGGYGHRFTPGPGYYYGNRIYPAPRVGAFATAPWDDGSYYGYVGPEY
jgi:hypothetical protein